MTYPVRLPTAKDAEQQVIGSLLIEPALIEQVAKVLRADDFTDVAHKATFIVLADLNRKGLPVSAVIVKQHLDEDVSFVASVSPAVYLYEVGNEVSTIAHVDYHAGLVAEAGRKRRLHGIASAASEQALNGQSSLEVVSNLCSDVEDFQRECQFGGDVLEQVHDARTILGVDGPPPYLIEGAIPKGEFGVCSAKSKSLKTKTMFDASISMAIGQPFLKTWAVHKPVRVGFISREIRGNVLDGWVDDIAASHGARRADLGNLFIDDKLQVDLTDDKWLTAMRRMIEKFDLEILNLDPANLLLPGVDVNSLTEMTKHLARIKRLSEDTGATVLMIHHNRKNARDPRQQFAAPTLEDIHGSGFHNVVRFWILLNRRRDWEEKTRKHFLWLVMGGSSGHATRKSFVAEEGRSDLPEGTYWDVEISDPASGEAHDRANQHACQEAARMEADRMAVCNLLAKHPEGLTKTKAKTLSGVSGRRWPDVLETMFEECDIESTKVIVSNHKTARDGIKLATTQDF